MTVQGRVSWWLSRTVAGLRHFSQLRATLAATMRAENVCQCMRRNEAPNPAGLAKALQARAQRTIKPAQVFLLDECAAARAPQCVDQEADLVYTGVPAQGRKRPWLRRRPDVRQAKEPPRRLHSPSNL